MQKPDPKPNSITAFSSAMWWFLQLRVPKSRGKIAIKIIEDIKKEISEHSEFDLEALEKDMNDWANYKWPGPMPQLEDYRYSKDPSISPNSKR